MKIKKGFILREMSKEEGISVVVAVGENAQKLNGYLTLNESGALIWKTLSKGASVDEVVKVLLDEYDAPEDLIRNDVLQVIEKLREIGAIDD
ncbi:MAG: PqqD family protein [Clostridiales bacterium]|nr:PqqD family protein [Clostridiales bacterium]